MSTRLGVVNDGAILYLHGFRSSPKSAKGRVLRAAALGCGMAFDAPDLNCDPFEAVERALGAYEALKVHGTVGVVGSSLGGFYAACVAKRTGARAVLINPAVRPWEVVKNYLGEQTIYGTDRTLFVREEFADMLQELAVGGFPDPGRVLTLLATGDELLDWHEAAELYAQCPSIVIEGSDHQISEFEEYVGRVCAFLSENFDSL